MEQSMIDALIPILNSPELTVAVLLILFATKRIVPFWVYDEVVEDLEEFKSKESDIRKELSEIREEIRSKNEE